MALRSVPSSRSNSQASSRPTYSLRRSRWMIAAITAWAFILYASFFGSEWVARRRALDMGLEAKYVGRQACIVCHADQAKSFEGSHHDRAMDLATDETVLADFSDVTLNDHGVPTRMFRRDGKFWVNTEGPDGKLTDFEIKYVFGLEPLQQYMVEMNRKSDLPDNQIGQVQVLRWSWDTEKKKWFHLDPPDTQDRLAPDDPLHWTGSAQRWNVMCAECHSTNLVKNFDTKSAGYHTTFDEIDVSCEACHGPGSLHVQLSQRWIGKKDPHYGWGLANLKASAENQIQACAPCHARRGVLASGFRAGDNYYDFHAESLLTTGIYFADGQVQDEDYIHGSFLQSKMYHKGIRCTDCHDPHTARLKHTGNQVCTSCHMQQHPQAKYDTPAHHFHAIGSAGAMCVNCHMPSTIYMEVDSRRDHSFRIPRPDLSVRLGTPNACTSCHLKPELIPEEKRSKLTQYLDWLTAAEAGDRDVKNELQRIDRWCDEACDKWYGEKRKRDPHFAEALSAARRNDPDATRKLTELLSRRGDSAPAIARATAMAELSRVNPDQAGRVSSRFLDDEHPLVRAAAASAAGNIQDPGQRLQVVRPALQDSSRSVRIEAARVALSTFPHTSGLAGAALQQAESELEASLMANNDRAGAHLALALNDEQQQRFESAIQHYEDAIRVEPGVTGARTNLAALLENLAERAHQTASGAASADGLRNRARELRAQELLLLERDVKLLPTSSELQHRYGLALYIAGDLKGATTRLEQATRLAPERPEYSMALALLYQKRGMLDQALLEAERLKAMAPQDPQAASVLQSIRQEISNRK